MATYYDGAGKQLKGNKLKSYLKALAKAQAAGTEYTGQKYYTSDELSQMYNGYDLAAIQKAGALRYLLKESPQDYNARSDAELQALAEAQYAADANTAKNAAQALYRSNVDVLNNQSAALEQPYQQQVSAAKVATDQTVDSLTGSMLSRGLGRSSYSGALQKSALTSGANTVNSILGEKTQKQSAIGSQIATLGTNLNSALSTVDQNQASSVKAALENLKQTDFEKAQSASDARVSFLANVLGQKKKVSSTTSSNTSTRSTNTTNAAAAPATTDWLSSFLGNLASAFTGSNNS